MAPLVPDDVACSQKYFFDKQYESFFIQDKYSHLVICLRLMDPHFLVSSGAIPMLHKLDSFLVTNSADRTAEDIQIPFYFLVSDLE